MTWCIRPRYCSAHILQEPHYTHPNYSRNPLRSVTFRISHDTDTVDLDMKTNDFQEEQNRITKIIANVDKEDSMELLNAWEKYLEEVLIFPFSASVIGYMDKGPLKFGDKVSVKGITLIDDLYGIIVELRFGRKKYHHPLDDLDIIDKDSSNYQHINDYAVWMANW